ncbi:helix-turn-helix domain-containing protein [Crenobacter sp. HX-7-9]|uniref:Helix-turn-helix domain-containing protein n=2 Tax=Crenobacter caeni TaxID=2705474 RepID=A0A6B2KU67_9NEIS|nr:helix-turn-helix domain-containing protein [Crenobacter caeni]NDV13762.1 helix-turn-helix domain-containing protein [Crenobacter caeni]
MHEEQTAALVGVKPTTLQQWRWSGKYNLPFVKVGRLVRYRKSDVLKWLESRTQTIA